MKQGRRRHKFKYTLHDEARVYSADKSHPYDERSEFERDRSRIIHSAAFRRLQGKTQVFGIGEGDFWRTRLTHSLEVAQIGKGLALRLGADTDLVEAISLVHDIGHPPFGHAGEDELRRLMMEYGGFEANAQNIRIITKLERKSHKYDGLNLTRAVIDGQMKYKYGFAKDRRKFVYEDDLAIVKWASEQACAAVNGPYKKWQSFECEIMDWADKVAYAVHDLEDSIHTGYIDPAVFRDEKLIIETAEQLSDQFKCTSIDVPAKCVAFTKQCILQEHAGFRPLLPAASGAEQKADRKALTSYLIHRYIRSAYRCERGDDMGTAVSRRYRYHVHIPTEFKVEVGLINQLIRNSVFEAPQIRTLEEKGKHIIRSIFLKFMWRDNARGLLPFGWRTHLEGGRLKAM